MWAGDISTLTIAAVVAAFEPAALMGAIAVAALIVVQRLLRLRPTPRRDPRLTQTAFGLVVVMAAAVGMVQA